MYTALCDHQWCRRVVSELGELGELGTLDHVRGEAHGPFSTKKFPECDSLHSRPLHFCPHSPILAEMPAPGITGRTRPTKVKKRENKQKRKRDDVDVEKLEQAVQELVSERSA